MAGYLGSICSGSVVLYTRRSKSHCASIILRLWGILTAWRSWSDYQSCTWWHCEEKWRLGLWKTAGPCSIWFWRQSGDCGLCLTVDRGTWCAGFDNGSDVLKLAVNGPLMRQRLSAIEVELLALGARTETDAKPVAWLEDDVLIIETGIKALGKEDGSLTPERGVIAQEILIACVRNRVSLCKEWKC